MSAVVDTNDFLAIRSQADCHMLPACHALAFTTGGKQPGGGRNLKFVIQTA